MIIGSSSERPVVLSFGLTDWQVVDARDATAHEPVFIELPVLVSVGPEPIAGVVMPLVGEPHRNAVFAECPELFDKAVLELLVPLAGEKLDDRRSSREEL